MSDQENHDVFAEDNAATTSEADIGTTTEEVKDGARHEAETQSEARTGAEESKQEGDEHAAETPAAGDNQVSKAEKMIPESQFKAALKNVTTERDTARRELQAKNAAPPPDPRTDPEGARLHDRIEISKQIMVDAVGAENYDATIAHFQEMVKSEPSLNVIISKATNPAKMAYDLAKKDQELTELYGLKDSQEWKDFQAYKTAKAAGANAVAQGSPVDAAAQLGGVKAANVASKVPNLNRNAPSVNRDLGKAGDDNLFDDHYSSKF